MTAGEQGSTPLLVMLETRPRETFAFFFFVQFIAVVLSTCMMQQHSIAYTMVIIWVYFFYIQLSELIFTIHDSRSQGTLSEYPAYLSDILPGSCF